MRQISFVILSILCSCSTTPDKNLGYVDYDWTALEERVINPIKMEIDSLIDYNMGFKKIGNKILADCPNCMVLYEVKGNELRYKNLFIKKGEGPFEVLSNVSVDRMNDGRFVATENIGSKKVFVSQSGDEGELEDISKWRPIIRQDKNTKYFFQTLLPINDSLFLGSALGDCSSKFVVNHLNTGESDPLNYSYPEVLDNLSDFEKAFAYDGYMHKKPDDSKYVYFTQTGLYSFIFDFMDGKLENFEYVFNQPVAYQPNSKGNRPRIVDPKSIYTTDCYVTKNYIYYSNMRATVEDVFKLETKFEGYSYGYTREIISFDWNGKPYKKFILDRPVRAFFVEEDDSMIYGVAMDTPDSDEEYVVGYNLNI